MGDGPTRSELLNALAHRLNKTPPPAMDAATETRLASYLNQRHRRLLTMPGMSKLRDTTTAFISSTGRSTYAVSNVSKIKRIWERTNERVLYEMSLQDVRFLGNPMQGTPEAFIWLGPQVVEQHPPIPSVLTVVSTRAEDTATVQIEGITDAGVMKSASVALLGLTPVTVAPPSLWARIDKFYLSAPCLGTITLSAPSNVLGDIPPGQVTSIRTALALYPTPSASITYFVDMSRVVTDLVQPTDQATIPEDFADLLVLGALADEYQHLSDPRWSTAITEYKEREHQLKYWLAETAIGRPRGLTEQWQRPSQLGSWYPAGS